ncbi:hypothetical protein [Methanobrevibacter sp.]|uniref:hypothetical protein n=1 Tax=Methanobrevibacter sp. TaxID=66852 RepID=UPI003865B331
MIIIFVVLISCSVVSAHEDSNQTMEDSHLQATANAEEPVLQDASSDLKMKIDNAKSGDVISINPGTYKIHNIKITKNITLQGNGNPRNIIIDGENKSSIFLIRSSNVKVIFKNLTFINGLTDDFGGAISNEKGKIYVDECIFINNTALKETNAGGISNYGTKYERGYLFVNNSLFVNNHADHDGGAITTCYADSDIYNCVFINNSARRDGGAIRVSVFGYGNVQDCIFMFNHADEWGGAYYSWSGESNIERCIFMNNTAGTNGGAVMVSGNINIENSIIVNNNGGETGGSFYIQQPMYDKKTTINVHNNIITNNTSPLGKEIFIKWQDTHNLYTKFDNNDWGDEDPNDSSINDPNNVTPRIKVSSTIKSNLFSVLNLNQLDKYSDLLKDFFPEDTLDNLKQQFKSPNPDNHNKTKTTNANSKNKKSSDISDNKNELKSDSQKESNLNRNANPEKTYTSSNGPLVYGNSTSHGEDKKAYELNETGKSVSKQANLDIKFFIAGIAIIFLLLAIGYRKNKILE